MGIAIIMVILGLLAWATMLTEESLMTNVFLTIFGSILIIFGASLGRYVYKEGNGGIQWW